MLIVKGPAVVDAEEVNLVTLEQWTDSFEDFDIYGNAYKYNGLTHGPFVTISGPVTEKLFRKLGSIVCVWLESPTEVTEPILAKLTKIERAPL